MQKLIWGLEGQRCEVQKLTHSLHRLGEEEELINDYVLLAMLARGFNDKHPDARNRLVQIGKIFSENNPASIMDEKLWNISPVISASFDDIENVKKVLKMIKDKNLGISIVISGLISKILELAKEIDLTPHTIHLSLGVFGNKELLPKEDILKITTMCGHHCISPQSVEHYADLIVKGKISIKEAAEKLAKCCVCGIFNPIRAQNLLNKIIKRI
ncbi:MAG: hypothetical protein ACTSRP_15145 [Candidatus Helarchaeota archaeon]